MEGNPTNNHDHPGEQPYASRSLEFILQMGIGTINMSKQDVDSMTEVQLAENIIIPPFLEIGLDSLACSLLLQYGTTPTTLDNILRYRIARVCQYIAADPSAVMEAIFYLEHDGWDLKRTLRRLMWDRYHRDPKLSQSDDFHPLELRFLAGQISLCGQMPLNNLAEIFNRVFDGQYLPRCRSVRTKRGGRCLMYQTWEVWARNHRTVIDAEDFEEARARLIYKREQGEILFWGKENRPNPRFSAILQICNSTPKPSDELPGTSAEDVHVDRVAPENIKSESNNDKNQPIGHEQNVTSVAPARGSMLDGHRLSEFFDMRAYLQS